MVGILQIHVEDLLKRTRYNFAKTEPVKNLLNYQSWEDYIEQEFDPQKDASLIRSVILNKDDPLIIIRLLNIRNKEQRKLIITLNIEIAIIIDYMPDYEKTFVNSLLIELN